MIRIKFINILLIENLEIILIIKVFLRKKCKNLHDIEKLSIRRKTITEMETKSFNFINLLMLSIPIKTMRIFVQYQIPKYLSFK